MIWIGWMASVLLCFTVSSQVHRQWRSKRTEGVSPWLYVGQIATSVLFTTYSISRGDPVFIATNAFLLVIAVVGLVMFRRGLEEAEAAAASRRRGMGDACAQALNERGSHTDGLTARGVRGIAER